MSFCIFDYEKILFPSSSKVEQSRSTEFVQERGRSRQGLQGTIGSYWVEILCDNAFVIVL